MGNLARDTRLLAATAVALLAVAGTAAATTSSTSSFIENWNGAAWRVTPAHSAKGDTSLAAATAVSASDVWAVGSYTRSAENALRQVRYPLAEHYDGASWTSSVLPTPQAMSLDTRLVGVSATSSSDVWAVGVALERPLIEHYNGKAWKLVSSANGAQLLSGVAAISRRNAWAVGQGALPAKPIIEHWNGRVWKQVASPQFDNDEHDLVAISARSARDIWAVGGYCFMRSGGYSPHCRTLVIHWNGHQWTSVPCPSPSGRSSSLSGVVALGANDVWAVGKSVKGTTSRVLTEHWDGYRWHIVPAPSPSAKSNSLSAVSAVSSTNVWAVGVDGRPLVERWNGHAWKVSKTAASGGLFSGIAAVSSKDVWAVGSNAP